jgi:O-acetyl-ADP-ribose deacetylase (regulator of RNase III)
VDDYTAVIGSIVEVDVDAIITLANAQGTWIGAIDRAIMTIADNQYHARLAEVRDSFRGLRDGQVIIARQKTPHDGGFTDVIFVVDDYGSDLDRLVLKALNRAEDVGYRKVAMPLLRTGILLEEIEPTMAAVIKRMQRGIRVFRQSNPDSEMEILIVVHDNGEAMEILGL